MKTKVIMLTIFGQLLLNSIETNGQFVNNLAGPSSDQIGETDPSLGITAIGIGCYTCNSDWPKAALEIKVPYLSAHSNPWLAGTNPAAQPGTYGEALHTIATSDWHHAWRMYTYKEQSDDIEKFNIVNYGNSQSVQLDVVQNGHLELLTNNTHYGRIDSLGFFGLSDDWSTNMPFNLAHLHRDKETDVYMQVTNGNTGIVNSGDGLLIGIDYAAGYTGSAVKSIAKINQQENAPI